MLARNATLPDTIAVSRLIEVHTQDGTLLPRSFAELCENIRDFIVIEHEGEIVGCGALHLYGLHLAEIRSIAVLQQHRGRGAGKVLVDALLAEAARQQVKCVCLFTRVPLFFEKMGFQSADKSELPDKLYKDCLRCPRLNACDEVAMVRGEIPKFAILSAESRTDPNLVGISHWF